MAGLTHAATASRWLRGHDAAAMLPDGPWGAELQGVAMFRVHPHGSDESQQLCSPYRPALRALTAPTHPAQLRALIQIPAALSTA
jgi:hypothetical protein